MGNESSILSGHPTPKETALMGKKRDAAIATLTIHRAGEMTPEGRKAVATWLRSHAALILKEGRYYSSRFTGRYMAR